MRVPALLCRSYEFASEHRYFGSFWLYGRGVGEDLCAAFWNEADGGDLAAVEGEDARGDFSDSRVGGWIAV